MSLDEILKTKRQAILKLAVRHGIREIRVFGSVARGEERAGSDVDFLVTMEEGQSLFDLGGFLMDLQELLGCEVDVVTEEGLRARIRDRVVREAVPL